MLKIIEVDYGIANRFNGYIEVHKNLKDYPELYKPIIKHELSHTDNEFSIKDLKLDLLESKVNNWKLIKFMLKNPKSFRQLSPFYKSRNGWFIDYNLLLVYGIFFITFLSIVLIGGFVF